LNEAVFKLPKFFFLGDTTQIYEIMLLHYIAQGSQDKYSCSFGDGITGIFAIVIWAF